MSSTKVSDERIYLIFLTTYSSYLCFLIATAVVTFEFVITAQCFCVTKTLQTVGDTGVLVNINLKIKEIFIFTAHL
jgi:hypothetical protein